MLSNCKLGESTMATSESVISKTTDN